MCTKAFVYTHTHMHYTLPLTHTHTHLYTIICVYICKYRSQKCVCDVTIYLGRQRTVRPTIWRLFLIVSDQVLNSKTFASRQNEEHVCKMYSFRWRPLPPPSTSQLMPHTAGKMKNMCAKCVLSVGTHDKMDKPASFVFGYRKRTNTGRWWRPEMGLGKQMLPIYNWQSLEINSSFIS